MLEQITLLILCRLELASVCVVVSCVSEEFDFGPIMSGIFFIWNVDFHPSQRTDGLTSCLKRA